MSRIMSLVILGIATCASLGQDPTVPSQAIVEKLRKETSATADQITKTAPKMKLKAIVLIDRDHGVATIEADGQRIRVRLDRSLASDLKLATKPEKLVEAVQIGGVQFTVEDFSARTIVLTDGMRRVLVQ